MENWFIRNKNIDYREISKRYNISPVISKILVNRDIYSKADIEKYLHGSIEDLNDPSLMLGIAEGANLIKSKIFSKKKIRIVGDYDVDGIMSIYILYMSLKRLGASVDYVIPNRVEDGYGINKEIVENAKVDKIDTLITCDNGIAALEAIDHARKLGLTVIITDHHDLIFEEVNGHRDYIYPDANVIINPKNPKCSYPFKYLCGAGVVFKLIQYLYSLYKIGDSELYALLEFVAIATVCDVVDLTDENRIIVKYGLDLINSTNNIGLKALIKETAIKGQVTTYHLGFILGPILNATGRLESANLALDLLLSKEEEKIEDRARELKALNDERKDLTEKGIEKVVDKIEKGSLKEDKILVIYEESIHESIAGIIAGRVKESYNRPTIVLTRSKDGVKGSGRSIEEYDMFTELTKVKDLLTKFGGHPMAAGLALREENIDLLRIKLNSLTKLDKDDLIKKIYIDMALPIEYISYKQIMELSELEPFGKGNSKPIFGDKNLKIKKGFKLGANKNVLKLILESDKNIIMEAMIFNKVDLFEEKVVKKYGEIALENMYQGISNSIDLDILYYPSINEFRGKSSLQVIIQSYRL